MLVLKGGVAATLAERLAHFHSLPQEDVEEAQRILQLPEEATHGLSELIVFAKRFGLSIVDLALYVRELRLREPPQAPSSSRPPDVADLWDEFKRSGSPEARERLILHYAPLAKHVASLVAPTLATTVEMNDLISFAMFGLIDALEKFDLERSMRFETYAFPRIKNAIIDELDALS